MAYTTINKGSSYFNTVLYTGTGASNARTGVGFKPDLVWIKGRSGATDHGLYDAVRGVQKQLESNNTDTETTEATGLTAFGSDGFTVGALAQLNTSSATYVAWNWLGANTTVSNTSGSITSTVSANTTSGFSIVSYTGNGTGGATIGHGLGSTPKMMIVRNRTVGSNWRIYHASLGNTQGMQFDTTAASTNIIFWNNTSPTSTLFTVGNGTTVNSSAVTYIAYCFAEVKGFSKFGSYVGNSSADGTFVYTGFKPAFVMVKNTNYVTGTDWFMLDNKRNTNNVENLYLSPNLSAAEATGVETDFLSNGFKLRHSSTAMNNSSYTYIYMAFADSPFVSSKGIPTTARWFALILNAEQNIYLKDLIQNLAQFIVLKEINF